MNQKIVLSLFIVAIGAVVLGIVEFVSLEQYQALPPIHHMPFVATTTSQAVTPQPIAITPPQTPTPLAGPQVKCSVSQEKISTSTWKTFKNQNWEITFQYPPNWEIDQNRSDLIFVSGDGNQLGIRMDVSDHGPIPTGAEEPSYCPRTVFGQRVDVGEFYFSSTHTTSTRLVGVQQTHSYSIYFDSPSSTADTTGAIFYTILDTMQFVKK